jgi:hypothetical protein
VNLSTFLEHSSAAGLFTVLVLLGCSVYIAALGRDLHLRCKGSALDGDWSLAQLRYLLFNAKVPTERAQAFRIWPGITFRFRVRRRPAGKALPTRFVRHK